MNQLFKSIELTGQLTEARDAAKLIHGSRYAERIAPYRETLQRWQKQSGKPLASVCFQLCKTAMERGNEHIQMLAFAACVEEMEAGGVE